MYSQEPFLLVHCSQSGYPLGVSPVTQTVCCVIPSCSYSWTVLCAPQRDNSIAADKSLVAVGYPESAPSRVLHSCLSLPTGAITAWKWHIAPSPHTCLKRPCVSTGQPGFAHKQNTDFFAGPSLKVALSRRLVLWTASGLQNSTPSVACYRFMDTAVTRLM